MSRCSHCEAEMGHDGDFRSDYCACCFYHQPEITTMPNYDVEVSVTLSLRANMSVLARDEDEAERKVEEMIAAGDFKVAGWTAPETKEAIAWKESGQDAEVTGVNEE